MRDVCNQCGGTVTNRLLQRSHHVAVVHRECHYGHKEHRVTGEAAKQPGDPPEEQSVYFVVVEPCDCVSGQHEGEAGRDMIDSLRSSWKKLAVAGPTLLFLAVAGVFIAARPVCAYTWSTGTDSAELADTIAALLDVKPASAIAEIGAGHGYMAVRMAEKVTPDGHLYATEIDPDELTEILQRANDADLADVTVLKATDTETGLKPECCDGIYMTDVYHHFVDPIATDKSIFVALKPGGRLFISDFYPTWLFAFRSTWAMRRNFGGHGVAEPLLISQLESVGFQMVEEIKDYPPKWPSTSYSVVMQKPQAEPTPLRTLGSANH